jgi:transcriptional regulator with XRE-family HTH domain
VNLSAYDPSDRRMSRRVLRGFNPTQFAHVRHQRGLSVSDLARLADIGTSTIHAWEAGTRTPQIDLLARVMDFLQTPVETVVTIPIDERYPGDWRVMKGLTQPSLAAAAKIATTTLRGIERADQALSDSNAATLARLLGITVEEYRAAYHRARRRPSGAPI